MNDKNRRYLEAAQRCRQWIIVYLAFIPAGSMLQIKTVAFTNLVNELDELVGQLESAVGEGLSATDVKGSERLELISVMEKVRNAARAAETDHPGTRDRYRYTTTMPNQDLLAAGRSFAEGGSADEAMLVTYGAPAGWMIAMNEACDEFEASFAQQDAAIGGRIAKKATINEKMDEMISLKATIGHMIPNFFAGNTGAIAAWASAAHIEASPKKKKKPDDDPGESGGSSGNENAQ